MVQGFHRIDSYKCKHRSDLNIDRISAANLNKDFGMIFFCPPAFNPSRLLSKIKTLRENRKRTNSWPDVFRRFKSWGVLQAAVCLLCKVELSGKIKMAESQVRLLLDIKRTNMSTCTCTATQTANPESDQSLLKGLVSLFLHVSSTCNFNSCKRSTEITTDHC